VAETPDKATQGDEQPEAAHQGASRRVPAIVVSLFALAVIGAATANSLPNFWLPDLDRFSLPNFSLPNFSLPNFSLPNFDRFAAQSPRETASAPIPDPAVSATLKDIQLSQQQNAAVLASLTQSSATQQADLKRISRQISSLAAQTDALQSAVTPLTTSSIPHSNTRARVVGTSRKIIPALPKPVGPVSVGGAPLSPAPAPGSGAG
jgi:outer membrane murein-binding lipoprotein Lpp